VRHSFVTGEFAAVGLGNAGFDFRKLPFFACYKIFNGLYGHIRAGSVQLLREQVQAACNLVWDTDCECCHQETSSRRLNIGEPLWFVNVQNERAALAGADLPAAADFWQTTLSTLIQNCN
jgi:hypothetical protein